MSSVPYSVFAAPDIRKAVERRQISQSQSQDDSVLESKSNCEFMVPPAPVRSISYNTQDMWKMLEEAPSTFKDIFRSMSSVSDTSTQSMDTSQTSPLPNINQAHEYTNHIQRETLLSRVSRAWKSDIQG